MSCAAATTIHIINKFVHLQMTTIEKNTRNVWHFLSTHCQGVCVYVCSVYMKNYLIRWPSLCCFEVGCIGDLIAFK